MIRALWHCINISATKDLRGAANKVSGEMYDTGAFSEDTKATPNSLLNEVEKKGPQSFREASDDPGLGDKVLERGWEL